MVCYLVDYYEDDSRSYQVDGRTYLSKPELTYNLIIQIEDEKWKINVLLSTGEENIWCKERDLLTLDLGDLCVHWRT